MPLRGRCWPLAKKALRIARAEALRLSLDTGPVIRRKHSQAPKPSIQVRKMKHPWFEMKHRWFEMKHPWFEMKHRWFETKHRWSEMKHRWFEMKHWGTYTLLTNYHRPCGTAQYGRFVPPASTTDHQSSAVALRENCGPAPAQGATELLAERHSCVTY